ncbi:hypothetical protein P1S61_36980 [Streptomyces sp. ME08-AFT2]|uniref:hypothetical protein n=1 Tax=Streptomyces sp. ME08-AFT2 TaxID=3028683 RepID=UPI0029BF9460|nr:hypothetical protein [Streptomyces sp. ME08-AFT2]MDX3314554.1 hypothetical protein [Streptomyces sp. ME08-AFT2]
MQQPTEHPTGQTIPSSYAWCSWHDGFDGTCRLVRIIEQGSGPGGGLFACTPCRARHGLTPVADQP